jgi:mannose-1-phosphate guanylyltransferase
MALRRAAAIAPPARTLVAVTQRHEKWWRNLREVLPAENLIVQPAQRGTGIGILHPLLEILARDPAAVVAVLPSDHYFSNEETLAASLRGAMACTRKFPRQILLLGLEPDEPDPELGYIVPASPAEQNVRGVCGFVEKPDARNARALIDQGALWNSFIIAADGRALLGVFQRRYPGVVSELRKFLALSPAGAQRRDEMARLYDQLPSMDFSRDILVKCVDVLRVLPLAACGWSDLGTQSSLHRILSRHRARISSAPQAPPGARGHVDLAAQSAELAASASPPAKRRHSTRVARA